MLWRGLQLLLVFALVVHLVFLVIPRPRSAYGAPRPWVYTVLAFVFPGTGLADEAWGVFLLVPWAVAGTAALSQAFGWPLFPPVSPPLLYLVLGGLYALNAVAVTVERMSHRAQATPRPSGVRRT